MTESLLMKEGTLFTGPGVKQTLGHTQEEVKYKLDLRQLSFIAGWVVLLFVCYKTGFVCLFVIKQSSLDHSGTQYVDQVGFVCFVLFVLKAEPHSVAQASLDFITEPKLASILQ